MIQRALLSLPSLYLFLLHNLDNILISFNKIYSFSLFLFFVCDYIRNIFIAAILLLSLFSIIFTSFTTPQDPHTKIVFSSACNFFGEYLH